MVFPSGGRKIRLRGVGKILDKWKLNQTRPNLVSVEVEVDFCKRLNLETP